MLFRTVRLTFGSVDIWEARFNVLEEIMMEELGHKMAERESIALIFSSDVPLARRNT